MRRSFKYIQLVLLFIGVVLLYSFSANRNEKRIRSGLDIKIEHQQDLFVTDDMLRTEILKGKKDEDILDSLSVRELERSLSTYGLIENAEVYETIDKNIGIEVKQREPLARVLGKTSYYIDRNGKKMPLSPAYTARVPLIAPMDSLGIAQLYPLLKYLNEDEFMKQQVVGIERGKSGDYGLRLRRYDFNINIGAISDIEKKMNNFKSFYKKAKKDSLLGRYRLVNLKYTNQVICTKREV